MNIILENRLTVLNYRYARAYLNRYDGKESIVSKNKNMGTNCTGLS